MVKRVGGTFTGTTPLTIWTPETGNRILLNGIYLQAWVVTALVGATPFDFVGVCAGTNSTVLWDIGRIASATDAAGISYGYFPISFPGAYAFANVDSPLVVATGATIGTGVIRVRGFVYGSERLG